MAGWRTVIGDQLFGRTTLLITLGWALWAGVITGQPAARNATAAVSAVATLALLRLTRLPLLALIAATAVHGYLAGTPASIVLFGFALCAISYAVGVLTTQRRLLAEQGDAQHDLGRVLDDRTAAHDLARDTLVLELERAIDDEVARIDGPRTLSAQLRRLAVDVVRPVSYELAAELRRWTPPTPHRVPLQVSWNRVWHDVSPASVLDPLRLGLALTVVAMASGPLDTVLTAVLVPVTTAVLARVVARFPHGTAEQPLRLAASAAVLTVAALPAALVGHAPLLVGAAPVVGMALAGFTAAHAQAVAAQRTMSRSLAQLEWAAARSSLVDWFHRSEVSRGLHGPIPVAIGQIVPRLAETLGRGEPTFALVGELQRRMVHGLGALVNPRAEGIDLERELEELTHTWGGTAELAIDVRGDVLPPLSADPACATAAIDGLTEACASAVRGGGATLVRMSISAAPNGILLTVMDNGRYDASAFEAELTARLLDQCAIRWYRKHSGDHNALVALLPYRPDTTTARPVALPQR